MTLPWYFKVTPDFEWLIARSLFWPYGTFQHFVSCLISSVWSCLNLSCSFCHFPENLPIFYPCFLRLPDPLSACGERIERGLTHLLCHTWILNANPDILSFSIIFKEPHPVFNFPRRLLEPLHCLFGIVMHCQAEDSWNIHIIVLCKCRAGTLSEKAIILICARLVGGRRMVGVRL